MNAMKVYRLADGPIACRRYIDGRRVSRAYWVAVHCGHDTDTYASRMQTRRDGSTLVREYHCIRSK